MAEEEEEEEAKQQRNGGGREERDGRGWRELRIWGGRRVVGAGERSLISGERVTVREMAEERNEQVFIVVNTF